MRMMKRMRRNMGKRNRKGKGKREKEERRRGGIGEEE